MTMAAKGVAKLIEETGELQQVLGKKLAWWDTDDPHWDGQSLRSQMQLELGDVLAAIDFVVDSLGLDGRTIMKRREEKSRLFAEWDLDPSNNEHGIDGYYTPEQLAAFQQMVASLRAHGYVVVRRADLDIPAVIRQSLDEDRTHMMEIAADLERYIFNEHGVDGP